MPFDPGQDGSTSTIDKKGPVQYLRGAWDDHTPEIVTLRSEALCQTLHVYDEGQVCAADMARNVKAAERVTNVISLSKPYPLSQIKKVLASFDPIKGHTKDFDAADHLLRAELNAAFKKTDIYLGIEGVHVNISQSPLFTRSEYLTADGQTLTCRTPFNPEP